MAEENLEKLPSGAKQAAEKLVLVDNLSALKGHDFSRATSLR
jgi:hypothetical protein